MSDGEDKEVSIPAGDCECDDYDPLEFPDPDIECECGALTLEACICKDGDADLEEMLKECDCGMDPCTCNRPERANEFCYCCRLPSFQCKCDEISGEGKDEELPDLPDVLEADHPLMKKFQDALKRYLERELQIAGDEVNVLKNDLKDKRIEYEKDLENIYMKDHDTNQQRKTIQEYEEELKKMAEDRKVKDSQVKELRTENKKLHQQLDQETKNEYDARRELRALEQLVFQLETWRKDTEVDLTVRQRVSEKIASERRQLVKEKRELDMAIFKLSTETWRLESELERTKKLTTIKSEEIEQIRDQNAELEGEIEDAANERKRLISVWNSVVVNIGRRDKIHSALRSHYQEMEEGHLTLLASVQGMKKEEDQLMKVSQEAAMACDKIGYDTESVVKVLEVEEKRMIELEQKLADLEEFIALNEKDEELISGENAGLSKELDVVNRELTRRSEKKAQVQDTALSLMEETLRGDHQAKALIKSIGVLREKTRKQETTLMLIENSHAKMMLEIEMRKAKQKESREKLKKCDAIIAEAEKKIQDTENAIEHVRKAITRSQRKNDVKKNELLDAKKGSKEFDRSVQIMELECEKTAEATRCESLVADWLRIQGHVVRLSGRHERLADAMRLREQQVQIMEQKKAGLRSERLRAEEARAVVARNSADLRSKLEWLQLECKRLGAINDSFGRDNAVATIELSAKLKEAEAEIIQTEEEIMNAENEKKRLNEELDAARRAALVWHRKCVQALELKKKIQASRANSGEINIMKSEIHKMEIRGSQLRIAAERLSKELAMAADRRTMVAEKARASAAGFRPPPPHRVRLRLLRSARDQLLKDKAALEQELSSVNEMHNKRLRAWEHAQAMVLSLEDDVKELERTTDLDMANKQFTLEKLVRQQRLATELDKVVKRGGIKLRRPDNLTKLEYERSKDSVTELKAIVQQLMEEKPELKYKLQLVVNSLTVEPQTTSPHDSLSTISTCRSPTN